MVTADKVQNNLRDRIIFSDELVLASTAPTSLQCLFYDSMAGHAWQIEDVQFIVTVNYVVSAAISFNLGIAGTATYFINAGSLGAAAVGAGNAIANLLPVSGNKVLASGKILTATFTAAGGQTGKGRLMIRLRPQRTLREGVKRSQLAQATV